MDSAIADLEKFDKSLIGLFNLLKTVIKTHEKYKLNLSSSQNPILTRLERYIKIYDRTEPNEHVWYFQRLYNQNKSAILRGPERDTWLGNGNIILHYGEETGRPIKDAKIHLSMIYNTAIKLRDDVESSLQGLPDVDQSQELLYPTLFLLHLYRIFYEFSDSDEDKDKLSGYIKDLEGDAGIKSKPSKSNNSTEDNNGLDGILGMATGLMEQMGLKLPEGQKLPSGKDLNKAIGNVFQNPEAKSFIGDMMKDMQDCDNFGDMVGKLLNKLPANMDPATLKTVTDNAKIAGNLLSNNKSKENNGDFAEGSNDVEVEDGDEFVKDGDEFIN
jgi:hypothetical protein